MIGRRTRKHGLGIVPGVTFAEVLVELRRRRCLSQEELADATGVSVRTISNLEREATRPQRATAKALASGMRLRPDEREVFELALRDPAAQPSPAGHAGALPAPVGPLVGREEELTALVRLVRGAPERAVTVTGPGGVGKTRLALDVAWQVVPWFDRVDAVDLSPLRDRDEVLVAIGAALRLRVPATPAAICDHVADSTWLLLLDSVEHVDGACDDIAEIVARCPGMRLLCTGRSPWPRPPGQLWPLTPLPVPDAPRPGQARPDSGAGRRLAEVRANPAVALLVERARAVRPRFEITDRNVDAAVALCRRLDGLPLAIELAAGHLRERDLADVAADLADRATTLRADVVDLPGRHRTLRATVEWSTDRLSDVDRRCLAALGAFRGPATRTALVAVLRDAGLPTGDVHGSLSRLAETSLINVDPAGDRGLDLLDTIREIAADLLDESGLAGRCRTAHARYMLDLVSAGDHAAIDAEVDNVRAAVGYAVTEATGLLDVATVNGLAHYLNTHSRFAEAFRLLSRIAQADVGVNVSAIAHLRAGVAANQHGDHRAALALGERTVALAHPRGPVGPADTVGVDLRVAGLNLVGAAYKSLGELALAEENYTRCLAAAEEIGNSRYVTIALNNLGTVAHERGAYAQARAHYTRSLEIKRGLDDARGIAVGHLNLGGLAKDMGETRIADTHLTQAVERSRRLGEPHVVAFALVLLADTRLAQGRANQAERLGREAAGIGEGIEQPHMRAMAEQSLGDIARSRRDHATAEAHYLAALGSGPEPFERMRLLDRLAAVLRHTDTAQAARRLAEADDLRDTRSYAIPPVDAKMVESTRRALTGRSRPRSG